MRGPDVRSLTRVATGGGRWTGPGRLAVGVLGLSVAAIVAAAVLSLRWALRSEPPARTLAMAAAVLREPPALDSALEVTWSWSVRGADRLEERWLGLVAPSLPPGICPPEGPAAGAGDLRPTGEDAVGAGAGPEAAGELGIALRQLDQAVVRGAAPGELERRILAVREAGPAAPRSRTGFVVRYSLARGYGAAGDWAAAAEVLEPALEGWIALDRVPETNRSRAESVVSAGRVDAGLALDAVHGRYLAGTVAYRRGEAERAVASFRRAINAFHYLLAARRDALGPDRHDQRVVAGLGPDRCPGARDDEALTSLDAYAGLVAAYMADEEFRDPGGLPAEVARTRLQIDPGDPLAPVLAHARRTGGDPDDTPIPENLLWAASNLQRVYHSNRLRPESRLEVTRAVLLLHLTRDPAWSDALARDGADVCAMLAGLGEDLRRDAGAARLEGSPVPAVDSARAAVAVRTFARLEEDCGGAGPAVVEAGARSAWIRLGGSYLTGGVGGLYEGMRVDLVSSLGASGAPVQVLEERVAPVMERIRAHRGDLRRNRVPAELPADVPVESVRRFVEGWWAALWTDVAEALAARVRAPTETGSVRAGEVPELLAALESAVDHAGLRPEAVYRADETAALAATGGTGTELAWRLRTRLRNRPGGAVAVVAASALFLSGVALLLHVAVWRYRLLVGRRFYREESAEGERVRRAA